MCFKAKRTAMHVPCAALFHSAFPPTQQPALSPWLQTKNMPLTHNSDQARGGEPREGGFDGDDLEDDLQYRLSIALMLEGITSLSSLHIIACRRAFCPACDMGCHGLTCASESPLSKAGDLPSEQAPCSSQGQLH